MGDPSDRLIPGRPAIAAGDLAEAPGISAARLVRGWPLALAGLACCWAMFFYELSGEWQVNDEYSYGFVVPFLGAALIWLRWPDRPPISPSGTGLATVLGALLTACLLPLRLVSEANPDWRLIYWLHGGIVIGLSFCLLLRAGGWPWLKYFAMPLVFMLIAVPWPMQMEQFCIQNLMRIVAGITVEIVGWFGIPALQHGNLIEVGTGIVGIDEACSGVRSLQAALMFSLFLGEMLRFSWRRRFGLVAGSLVVVLLANLVRTTLLTWTAANYGLKRMEHIHDTAGIAEMLVGLLCLGALAWLMKPKTAPAPVAPPAAGLVPAALPRWIGVGLIAWIGVSEAATQLWYHAHESSLAPALQWIAIWPVRDANFHKTTIPETSLAILRCSNSDAAAWEDDEGNQWSAFFLRWAPGKNSAQLAKGHRPDICFPAAGAKLLQDYGQVVEDVHGFKMAFHYQTFQAGQQLLNVFYCLWADRASAAEVSLLEDNSRGSRLQAVLAGKRHLGQRVLEMVVQGPETPDEAVKCFEAQLPAIIQPQ